MVGLGYVRVDTWPYDDDDESGRERIENRFYQQFAMKQGWARARFEHRFRLEQRWFPKNDGDSYSNRGRYRLQVTIPLNHETIQPGAYFINTFNETFINFVSSRPNLTFSSACSGRQGPRRISSDCSSTIPIALICVNAERRDEIRSYNFHGLMMGMLLGVKSFSFLVASVKLCV